MYEPFRILLIDDPDDADRAAVRKALDDTGVCGEVREVHTGAAALDCLACQTFDCALMDYHLPDDNGLVILKQARAAGVTTPIIMMTGRGNEQLAVDLMKAGASDYLSKSRASLDALGKSILTAVRLHRAERAAEAVNAKLRESEERFRAMADSAPVLLWLSGSDAKRFYFNEGWLRFAGRTVEQEQGDGWTQGIHPEDLKLCIDTYFSSIHARQPFELEYRLRRFDGEYRWVLDKGKPRYLPDETFVGYIGSCIDITERRTAEQALRETNQALGALIRASPLAIYSLDTHSRVRLWNPAAHRIFGWREKEVLGRFLPVVQPEMAEEHAKLRQRVLAGEKLQNFETVRVRKNGRPIDVSISAAPLLSATGKIIGMVAVTADITERKRGEQDLQRAKDAAEAANAAKDRFLAVLSHELRTPLTPVLMGVQSLECEPDLPADARSTVEMVRRNVELEARLIDDLLDLTRVARGKFELNLQTLDAHVALQSALDICRSDIVAKNLKVSAELVAEEHAVRADSARLQQVFWNLIKNAVKFTPDGGAIVVRSSNGGQEGRLRIEVVDSGIGIEPNMLPHIFGAFVQGEQSITRRYGGLGLGLAISKAMVDAMGGRLTAESQGQGAGATFAVELPTTQIVEDFLRPDPPKDSEHDADLAAPGIRILMVDDHEDTSRALKRLLETRGHRVRVAHTVAGALEAARVAPFDLLISDIGLPDGSGHELMRELRKQNDTPGIALSGFGMEEDVRKSKEAGFVEHLTKPINVNQLQAVIAQVTGPG